MENLPANGSPVFGPQNPKNQLDVETRGVLIHSPETTEERIQRFAKELSSVPTIPFSSRGSFSGKLITQLPSSTVAGQEPDSDTDETDTVEPEAADPQPVDSPEMQKTNTSSNVPFLQLNPS